MAEKAILTEIQANVKEIKEITEITQKILADENKITITNASVIPTIVYKFLRTTAAWLNEKKSTDENISIDIMGIMTMGVDYREAPEDAELDGNFVPFIEPGPDFKLTIKDNDATEDEE